MGNAKRYKLVAMTQRIKLLTIVFSTLLLTHCQDASNGRRMSGFGLNGKAAPLTQTGDAFTGLPNKNGIQNNELLQAVIASRKQAQAPVPESPISEIDYDDEKDSRAACIGSGTTDSDNDGLPDDCAEETNPDAYNGWVFGGRYYDPNSPELVITPAEEIRWREISKKYGGVNFSSMSPTSQKIFKKMELFRDPTTDSDIEPSKYAFYELGGIPILVSDLFKASKRSYLFQESQVDDMNLGIGAGDGRESPFVSRVDPATSAFDMTGFNKNTFSLLEKLPKTVVWQTNVIIPANVTHLEMAMAHAVDDSGRRIKPTSALYRVFNNNDTVLLKSKLISGQNNRTIARDFAVLSKNLGCVSANLIIEGRIDPNGQITPERPVFREPGKKTWTTLSQKYFSIVPIGGADCQKNFIDNTGRNNKSFFNIASNAAQRVPGVIDFNSGLSRPGIINPTLLIDGKTQSFDPIRQGLARLPIDKMDDHHVTEFLKAAHQLDPTLIKDEEKKKAETDWLAGVIDQATKQKAKVAGQPSAATTQLTQLTDLIKKLATLDPASPEYAAAITQIDKLIADLNADPNLDATQKQGLAAQVTQYGISKQAAVDAAAAAAAKAAGTIQLSNSGSITLKHKDMLFLKDFGFTFVNEDGTSFDPVANPNVDGKITNDELKELLIALEQRITDDDFKKASGQGARDLQRILDALKAGGADPATIDAFMTKHADKLMVQWTPEELEYLKTHGLTNEVDNIWSKGFKTPRESDQAKKDAIAKLTKKLLDPTTLGTYPIEDRLKEVSDMKKIGLIDDSDENELIYKIANLTLFIKNNIEVLSAIIKDANGKDREVLTLSNAKLFFNSGNNQLTNASISHLGTIAQAIKNFENSRKSKVYIKVIAHTDSDGLPATNQTLSEYRAKAVKDFLSGLKNIDLYTYKANKVVSTYDVTADALSDANKFDPAIIVTEGKGSTEPVKGKNKQDGKDKSRRVQVIFDVNPF
jgi:outer membrane protein OmpA-like peptidoglycan-associated protein/uncharacterized protein (DUF2141 family)